MIVAAEPSMSIAAMTGGAVAHGDMDRAYWIRLADPNNAMIPAYGMAIAIESSYAATARLLTNEPKSGVEGTVDPVDGNVSVVVCAMDVLDNVLPVFAPDTVPFVGASVARKDLARALIKEIEPENMLVAKLLATCRKELVAVLKDNQVLKRNALTRREVDHDSPPSF